MKVVLSPAPAQTPDPLPVDEPPPAAAEPAAPLSVDQPPPAAREPPILGLPARTRAADAGTSADASARAPMNQRSQRSPVGETEYDSIQMQMGVMSPTKLRMHLLGMGSSHGYGGANKDEAPSKSPPSRLDVDDHPKNSLLPQEPDQGSSSEYPKDRSDSSSSRSCSNGSHGR
ncbi:hypothetical protein ZWY2020_030162 [Hordeum vulgare]|nr:hypothetical protein ZWY2020_030162 [Hordeum vulgare]